jgi:hypothetical protein
VSTLLNDAQVREFAIATVRAKRPALARKMTRVSESFHVTMETRLRIKIFSQVAEADGGDIKTLRPPLDLPPRAADLPWLICQSETHRFIHLAIEGKGLTQVAGDYLVWCDHWLRQAIEARILSMTSVGKTIT